MGGAGQWTGAKPSSLVAGKLSRGGSPKDHRKLFKLTDPSFGTGIDAVWCAHGCEHNDGKPFAIIDAKASVSGKKPKYMSKPGISSLLEGSGSGRNRVVQMSHEWIRKNINRAVPPDIASIITTLLLLLAATLSTGAIAYPQFTCAYERDHNPPLDPGAELWFQEARKPGSSRRSCAIGHGSSNCMSRPSPETTGRRCTT